MGMCPVTGEHVASEDNYSLIINEPEVGQDNWRLCCNCQGLFLARDSLGVCPAGGNHVPGCDDYSLIVSQPGDLGQDNWHQCDNCQGLFFAGNSKGRCPAGEKHDPADNGSYSYTLNKQ